MSQCYWTCIDIVISITCRIITAYGVTPRRALPGPVAPAKRLSISTLGVVESVEALVRAGLVTEKRPNPKLRAKNRAKMMGIGGGK